MGRHAIAQQELTVAFQNVMGRAPTRNERLFAGAIALGESSYSRARYYNKLTGASKVLNNWGAIQCPSATRPCPEGSFEVSDHDVKADGTHVPFNQCYCDDATRELAAERFVKTLYQKRPQLLAAATTFPDNAREQLLALTGVNKVDDPAPLFDGKGTKVSLQDPYYQHIAWFSHVMRDSKYFGLELKQHIGAQIRYHHDIAADVKEYVDGSGPMANPKDPDTEPGYSREEWLSLLAQSLLHDAAKRHYAMLPIETLAVLRRYQLANGLKVDGIPGPITLKSLFG